MPSTPAAFRSSLAASHRAGVKPEKAQIFWAMSSRMARLLCDGSKLVVADQHLELGSADAAIVVDLGEHGLEALHHRPAVRAERARQRVDHPDPDLAVLSRRNAAGTGGGRGRWHGHASTGRRRSPAAARGGATG